MSDEKWTPGPWGVDPETRPVEICTIHGMPKDESTDWQGWAYIRGALGHWDVDEEEVVANAHLIAAAPDMAAAIQMFIDAIEGKPVEIEDAIGACRRSIDKARGES